VTHINVLDPGASPLDYYGFELRRHREAAGLTQKQLGSIINYTGSLVGQIETARKLPTPEFSERTDAALGTGGPLRSSAGCGPVRQGLGDADPARDGGTLWRATHV